VRLPSTAHTSRPWRRFPTGVWSPMAAAVGTLWLNGAPAGRIDLAGELDTAVSLAVADHPHLRDPQPAQARPARRRGHAQPLTAVAADPAGQGAGLADASPAAQEDATRNTSEPTASRRNATGGAMFQ
jgi:hypothetical protein